MESWLLVQARLKLNVRQHHVRRHHCKLPIPVGFSRRRRRECSSTVGCSQRKIVLGLKASGFCDEAVGFIETSLRRRRQERLERRAALQSDPAQVVPRLQPITHREGSPTLAPPVQVGRLCWAASQDRWMSRHWQWRLLRARYRILCNDVNPNPKA